jgi:hypothetical protein
VIDIVDTIDLLDSCVRDRGAGYRSPHRRGSADSRLGRCYTLPGSNRQHRQPGVDQGGCAAVSSRPVANSTVADVYASRPQPLNLTLGAVVALRAAESMERRGHTWGSCLQAAVRAASRFIEGIPDGVAGCAAEAAVVSHRGAPLSRHGECRCARRASGT